MRPFEHTNAESLDTAVSALAGYEGQAAVIAGGTDLLGTLKDEIHGTYPEALVNIKTIDGLSYVREDDKGLKIGALVTLHEIETNPVIKEKYSVLAEAARAVASPQIRRMGTIGGNVCQEPRCWYYRYPDNFFYCARKDGKYCNALTGENRFHSIFGAARVDTPPCSSACPAHVDIPTYVSEIRRGRMAEAARLLLETNPMPAITGRACPHFCEEECNRGDFDEAVSVRCIERFVGDYVLEKPGQFFKAPTIDTGMKVAIVGSGPAGLSAAHYLRRSGHRVIVFDRMPEPGGMLTHAIPPYRLPRDVVRRVVTALEKAGIEFRLNVDVGKDVTLDALRKEFDAVFLASGAWKQPVIGVEGEELTKPGLEFLTEVSRGSRAIPGQKVLVIGGGNVAADVGLSALRLGAKEVTLACLECREEMPAFEAEIKEALEEGVKLMPSWGPSRILHSKGKITGAELVRCTSIFDENACFAPTFDNAVTETVKADAIIMAVGQRTDLSFVGPGSSLAVASGLIEVDQTTQETNVPGLFAGGDVTTGPSSIVEVIAAGRRAAGAIHRYLTGQSAKEEQEGEVATSLLEFNSQYLVRTSRADMPTLPLGKRGIDSEDALGLDSSSMEGEANRCFNCGCVAVSPSDLAPALIALDARIKTTARTVSAEKFFNVGPKKSTILEPEELVTEIQIPAPVPGSKQAFLKFRIRKAIDFPIVGVAAVINVQAKKVRDARVVLGAVAPVPLRAREAEDFLRGKVLDEDVADRAANLALVGANPLGRNGYKVQIAKALVKRAILAAAEG